MNTHDYRIDRLRLLACFGVVMLHSSSGTGPDDLALNAIFRFSVPVFVIISGWFQLCGDVSAPRLAKKAAALFGKMLLWSGIYMLFRRIDVGTWPQDPLVYFLTEPVHLWYLYAAMGLCLLAPALAPFVRSADSREYHYALGICFAIGCCITTLIRMELFPWLAIILDKSKLPDMLGFVFLYLLGGYFRKFGFLHPKRWLLLGVICAFISVIAAQTSYNQQLLSFISPNVVLSGGACFVLYMTRRPLPERFQPLLRQASGCTMGVYLLHLMIDGLLTPHLRPVMQMLLPCLAMTLRCACIFTVTFTIIWLLRAFRPLRQFLL